MSRLLRKTITGWVDSKARMMQLLEDEKELGARLVYAKAVCFCDKKIAQIKSRRRELVKRLLVASVLSWTMASAGCNVARESCHLVGAACQDIGWTMEKIGENINTEEK